MLKPLLIASLASLLTVFTVPVHAQSLLLQYNFDDAVAPVTDTGTGPAAVGNLVAGGSASGFTSNTPNGTGSAFSTGDGVQNYLTTSTSGDPDGTAGDVAKLDGLTAFTLTLWVNLQGTVAT